MPGPLQTPALGQLQPFAVAAEISDEQRFAPARRSSGAVPWAMLGKTDSCCLILILCAPPHCDRAALTLRGNDMTRAIRLVLAGAIIAASCSAATAQTMRMSGTIEKADDNVLSLKNPATALRSS